MADKKGNTYFILFALWLMMFSASSQVVIVIPILPEISQTLGVNEFWQGILLGSYAFALGISAVVTGPISDRIGRRRILIIGSALMAVALTLHTVAADFTLLLVMRTLAGIGGGILSGGSVAYIGDYFPYDRRGWANGWVMSGTAFGQIAGVPIGKILATSYGYRWPFLLFAITMGVATVLIWYFLPAVNAYLDPKRLTLRRMVTKYVRLVRRSEVVAAVATYFLMFLGIGLFASFLPTWLEVEIGISGFQIALLFAIGGMANIVAAPVAGHVSDTIGRKPLVIASCIGLSAAIVVAPYLIDGFAMAAFLFFLAMVAVGIRISPLQALMTALVKDERRGLLMGLAIGFGQVGFGVGSFIAGITYGPYGYVSNTFMGAASVLVMAAIVKWGLPEPDLNAARPAQVEDAASSDDRDTPPDVVKAPS
ncbi:MAG: MFS transporter [Longimonas sp.]|uniref:MFS transporter n=1 Tax=Longimonas sp. TaxID=2039626 RepID=UPI00335E40B8